MNYIREFLYRPKRSDRSNMARFFYADENLTAVAAELDSFDGRKDPERCACLVNRLRSCQDKLINICNRMLEELEPGTIKRSREFRAKYPGMIVSPLHCSLTYIIQVLLKRISAVMSSVSSLQSQLNLHTRLRKHAAIHHDYDNVL